MPQMIKPSLLCVEVDEGTYIECGSRNFMIRNRQLFPLIERILGALDGRAEPAEVRAALPEKVWPLFDRLLASLERSRMLTTGPGDLVLDRPGLQNVFLYLQEVTYDARACYAQWSGLPLTLAGPPALILPLLSHLLASGAADLTIVADTFGPADMAAAETLGGDFARAVRFEDRQIVLARPVDRESLLVCALDGRPGAETLADLELIAARHGPCLFAAICGDLALIGPEAVGGLGRWPDLLPLLPGTDAPMAPLARAVLPALLAFEALQARLAPWTGEPLDAARRLTDFRILQNDCRVATYDAGIALASQRPLAAASPLVENGSTVPEEIRQPLFDPWIGLLRDADVEGPEYPLAHRALSIVGGEGGTAVCAWGVDYASADERCLALALGIATDARLGLDHSEAGSSPTIVARSRDRLEALAAAYALADRHCAGRQPAPAPILAESLSDADLQVLIRLARLYWDERPALWLSGSSDGGGCIGWARIGTLTCAVPAPDEQEALFEALGDVLSELQLGTRADRQNLPPCRLLAGLALPESEPASLTDYLSVQNVSRPSFEWLEDLEDPLRAHGFFAGRAVVRL